MGTIAGSHRPVYANFPAKPQPRSPSSSYVPIFHYRCCDEEKQLAYFLLFQMGPWFFFKNSLVRRVLGVSCQCSPKLPRSFYSKRKMLPRPWIYLITKYYCYSQIELEIVESFTFEAWIIRASLYGSREGLVVRIPRLRLANTEKSRWLNIIMKVD